MNELKMFEEPILPKLRVAVVNGCPSVRFHNVDCMEFMKTIPDKFYDLAIVDPPYGLGFGTWDIIPTDEYFVDLFRVSKNQIIWGGNYFNLPSKTSWVCWDKSFSDYVNSTPYHKNGKFSEFELAWTSLNIRGKFVRLSDIGNITGFNGKLKVDYKKGKDIHPTQKPISLYRWTLQELAQEGMKILDTHGGSMSSAIACDMEGYDLDICEIDPEYFQKGVQRFQQYKSQKRLF